MADKEQLAKTLREIRFAAFPDGHLPPPAPPDPTEAEQAEAWLQLRHRILHLVPVALRPALLSISLAHSGAPNATSDVVGDDEQEQEGGMAHLQVITSIFAPLCAPEAAGPNTHLALLLFERIAAILDPSLLLSTTAD